MRLDDVEPRAQGCVSLRLYPETSEDVANVDILALIQRGADVRIEAIHRGVVIVIQER